MCLIVVFPGDALGASAQTIVPPTPALEPVELAGSRAVWVQEAKTRLPDPYDPYDVVAQSPGKRRRVLAHLVQRREGKEVLQMEFAFAASGKRFAVLREDWGEGSEGADYFVTSERRSLMSSIGGQADFRRHCNPPLPEDSDIVTADQSDLRLDGNTLASFRLTCDGGEPLVARSLIRKTERRFPEATQRYFGLAGRRLLYGLKGPGDQRYAPARVVDWSDGRVVQTVEPSEVLPPAPRDVEPDANVQADGKVLFSTATVADASGTCAEHLIWVAPDDPHHGHEIPVQGCTGGNSYEPPPIARDRVALVRPTSAGYELVTTNLQGQAMRRFAIFDKPERLVGIDYDGKRIVWNETRCKRTRIRIARDVGKPVPVPRPRCPSK